MYVNSGTQKASYNSVERKLQGTLELLLDERTQTGPSILQLVLNENVTSCHLYGVMLMTQQ